MNISYVSRSHLTTLDCCRTLDSANGQAKFRDVALTTTQDLQQRAKRCTHCDLLTNADLRWESTSQKEPPAPFRACPAVEGLVERAATDEPHSCVSVLGVDRHLTGRTLEDPLRAAAGRCLDRLLVSRQHAVVSGSGLRRTFYAVLGMVLSRSAVLAGWQCRQGVELGLVQGDVGRGGVGGDLLFSFRADDRRGDRRAG